MREKQQIVVGYLATMSLAHEINASFALFFFCRASWSNDETAHGCRGWSLPSCPCSSPAVLYAMQCAMQPFRGNKVTSQWAVSASGSRASVRFLTLFRPRRHLALLLVLPARHDLRVERITGCQLNLLFLPTSSPFENLGWQPGQL